MRVPQVQIFARLAPLIEIGCLLALAILRLYLTGDRDVLALNSAHDEFWYVHRAFVGVWSGPYDEMSFVHPPIYAVWLQMLKTWGIPARLGIDLALIASVFYLARSVRNISGSRVAAVLLATFLLLHPYSLYIFDRTLADTLAMVTVTAALAAGVHVWILRDAGDASRRVVAIVTFSIMFAICYHVRKEGIAFLAPVLVLLMLSFGWRSKWWSSVGFAASPGVTLLVWPLVATLCLGLLLSTFNLVKWGQFSRFELASSGFSKTVGALSAIDTGRTPLQVSVTRKMLQQGYAVSPTLAELQPHLDGPVGKQWAELSGPYITAKGEIGNGWFYWALRDAAAKAGWHSSASVANGKYRAVANELQDAYKLGTLKRRGMQISGFLDPDAGKWLPAVPNSFSNMLKLTVWPLSDVEKPNNPASARQLQAYARVAGLRSLPPSASVSGWVVAPPGTLIAIQDGSEEPAWTPISQRARPDVPGAYSMTVKAQALDSDDRLLFKTPDGKVGEVAMAALTEGKAVSTRGAFVSSLGIDEFDAPTPVALRADALNGPLTGLARIFAVIFATAMLVGFLPSLLRGRFTPAFVVAVVCLAFIGARLGLFAILDASSWNGVQARYVMPLLPLIACAGVLGLASLFDRFKPGLSPARAEPA